MFDARPSFENPRLDPDWWEDLAPSRAGLKPRFHDEDPRVVGEELGLLPPPRSLDPPPNEADFAALAEALRAEAGAAAHVRLGVDRRGRPSMVFRFPFDELLNLAVKRLPGRRFDWETREWTVPCMEHTAEEVADVLACFPKLAIAPAVQDWLASAEGWHAMAASWDVAPAPLSVPETLSPDAAALPPSDSFAAPQALRPRASASMAAGAAMRRWLRFTGGPSLGFI